MRLFSLFLALSLFLPATTAAATTAPVTASGKPAITRQSRRTILSRMRQEAQKRVQKRAVTFVPLTETYENAEIGVSIRHPKDWKKDESLEQAGNLTLVVMFLSPVRAEKNLRENINFVLEDVDDGTTLQEYTELAIANEKSFLSDFTLLAKERVTLASWPAQRIRFRAVAAGNTMRFEQVWFMKGGLAHVWTFADAEETFDKNLETFRSMLDTLTIR